MVDSYYLKPPRDQLFYKVMAHIATTQGTMNLPWWGYEYPKYIGLFYHIQRNFILKFGKLTFTLQMLFLIMNFRDLSQDVFITAVTITPLGMLVMVKADSSKIESYKDLMENFMDEVHVYNIYLKEKTNQYIKEKVIQVEKISRLIAFFMATILLISAISWIMQPTIYNMRHYDEIMNRTKEFHYYIYFWTPFDYRYNLKFYIFMHTICIYLGILAITIIMTFDTINFICVFHLVGHIYILKHRIKTNWSDDFSDDEVKEYLVTLIKYHNFIIKIFEDSESAFGFNVAANYLQNLIEDGLFLYQFMHGDKDNSFNYLLMLVVYLGGLIIMSIVLEEIRRQNVDLYDYVYLLPWENMSLKNKKILILFLQRTQTDLEFEGPCGMKAGVQPALSIIKSMFSYYVMINARL